MINSSVAFQVNYIPPEIASCKYLSITAKYVFGRIGGYTKKYSQDCWVTNAQLADECGISARSVAEAINQLRDHKLIVTSLGMYKNKKIRYIKVIYEPLNESAKTAQSDCANNSQSKCEEKAQSDCAKSASRLCKNCTMESAKSAQSSSIYRDKSREKIELNKTNTSSSQSHTQFSIEKIENDALYLQNIFTEEIMKLAKRNVEARNVSSFIESEKWLKWNRQNDKLKFIKSEKRLRELVSSWVLKSLENVVTHPEVINQEDLTEKRQAFLASLKY